MINNTLCRPYNLHPTILPRQSTSKYVTTDVILSSRQVQNLETVPLEVQALIPDGEGIQDYATWVKLTIRIVSKVRFVRNKITDKLSKVTNWFKTLLPRRKKENVSVVSENKICNNCNDNLPTLHLNGVCQICVNYTPLSNC